tara:strand:+ start:27 stop:371 length:345 start_codon:yes stop_codon:yes gene_type:complete
MKGPFKLKYNKSSFPFKEESNAIVAAAASANEEVEKGEGVAASFLSGFAGGLSQSKKKDKKKDNDKEKPEKIMVVQKDPKQSGPPPGGYSVEKPGPDPKTEIQIKKKKPGYYGV